MATSRLRPSTHRVRVENQMIRKRDKQYQHEQLWQTTQKYFNDFDKKNQKYDEWTSPRYYETNTKLIQQINEKRKKDENLLIRRDNLRKLLQNDDKYEQIELMIKKTKQIRNSNDDVDDDKKLEIFNDLSKNLKIEEDDRRRHEAELKLYHQWRNNHPLLHQYERHQRLKDIKLSWLDQQIEKRIAQEKEEDECRRILKENEAKLKEEQAKINENKQKLEQQQHELKQSLDKQIDELNRKKQITDQLKIDENNELKIQCELIKIQTQQDDIVKKFKNYECALYNLKQYKMKLKTKSQLIDETLNDQKQLIEHLKNLQIIEQIDNQSKRHQLQTTIEQFLIFNNEQKQLEKLRKQHMDFIFDSEAKHQYEQQNQIWHNEQSARQHLINDIIKTIQLQIDENLHRNQQKQKEILIERELIVKNIEEYHNEMEHLKQNQIKLNKTQYEDINKQIQLKKIEKKIEKKHELKRINNELENVRKEEERLKREILNIQRRQIPTRPIRNSSSRVLL